ncbi:MAG: putative membrane protein YeiH [Gammaproteobacteria bacterium]|jgi:uncharacterized membrane protein YeiH
MFPIDSVLLTVSYLGVAVFSMTGALAAAEKKLDLLGYIFFAVLVGVGGGTTRDLLLNEPVFWIADATYIYLGVTGGVAGYVLVGPLGSASKALVWFDAVGIAMFSVLGAVKANLLGHDPLVCVLMGSISATMGGLIRDVVLNRDPLILGDEIYVTPSLVGGSLFLGLTHLSFTQPVAISIAVLVAFAVRAGALLFDWRLPNPDDGS